MRSLILASRNNKEILRDPINLFFGIGFPLIILLLLSAIQANIPVQMFEIKKLSPGIAVFGLSFISLVSGMLLAKDKTSSFLKRLFISPLSSFDFILSYTLPFLPMAIAQSAICFLAAIFLGLPLDLNIILAIIVLIPTTVLFIGLGLLCGSLFTDKQVGGICGALLTNLSAWLSGVWFDVSLVGGWFEKIADILPFSHAVDAARAAVFGHYSDITIHLLWVSSYALIIIVLAIVVFNKKKNSDSL
jgi:ABC-2 type transport system permease protein